MLKNSLGKYMVAVIAWFYERQINQTITDKHINKIMQVVLWGMPIRGLVNVSQGRFSEETGEFLVAIANRKKRFIKGLQFFLKSLCMIKKNVGKIEALRRKPCIRIINPIE